MNKLMALLFLAVVLCLPARSVDNQDSGVSVAQTSALLDGQASDIKDVDLANRPAVFLGRHGRVELRQTLRNGHGRRPWSESQGSQEVKLAWHHPLDSRHLVAAYEWEWIAASSSQSAVVQVFELRESGLYITQQIDADMHHGGRAVGARFNPETGLLTVKAVSYAPREGRCCPSLMSIDTFRWNGRQFRPIRTTRVSLPADADPASP